MNIADTFLPEFDHEMANTRRALERVPDGRFDYKPDEKSPALGWLAWHVAMMPSWAVVMIDSDSLDLSKPVSLPPQPSTREGLLNLFETGVACVRPKIAGASDEHLMRPWRAHAGERTIFEMPRRAVLRGMFMNHLIHHRGQLMVYLRLNGVPIPGLYGPSADEPMP